MLFWGIIGVIVLRGDHDRAGRHADPELRVDPLRFRRHPDPHRIKLFWNALKGEEDEVKENFFIRWLRGHMRVTEACASSAFSCASPTPRPKTRPLGDAAVPVPRRGRNRRRDLRVDSVPAIFLITQDAFIVYTSNIFAIIGLRARTSRLPPWCNRFHYLKFCAGACADLHRLEDLHG